MLTQVEAARLMAAHWQAVVAAERCAEGAFDPNGTYSTRKHLTAQSKAADRDFEQLVAELTDSEGL